MVASEKLRMGCTQLGADVLILVLMDGGIGDGKSVTYKRSLDPS